METPEEDNAEMQSYSVRIVSSPEKMKEDLAAFKKYREWLRQSKGKEKAVQEEVPVAVESNSENDSDYNPGDDETSEDDDEATLPRPHNEIAGKSPGDRVRLLVPETRP